METDFEIITAFQAPLDILEEAAAMRRFPPVAAIT